ncbi:hypothetical protein GCM10011583_55120 [Streptomyces camponoticapitis]|uniref:Uncharacterized protein n=1 Tax=Streptomyces camponoticapitis TaxID=1616125 RepID=A0ABQ2ELP2_9ACTN|nr:hypothetical protein [Streptomyces camponoticapitis]GGK16208.1 hypothetical protein GCM10011583_55120 [Streptomyces camponoticapitis]
MRLATSLTSADQVARTMLKRGVVVGAAAAMMVGFASAPASAANLGIQLPNSRGTMTFTDSGDIFTVCDTRADGHGVTGTLRALNHLTGQIVVIDSWDDGGDSGCDGGNQDVRSNTAHDMVLCWHGGGACKVSRVFKENE